MKPHQKNQPLLYVPFQRRPKDGIEKMAMCGNYFYISSFPNFLQELKIAVNERRIHYPKRIASYPEIASYHKNELMKEISEIMPYFYPLRKFQIGFYHLDAVFQNRKVSEKARSKILKRMQKLQTLSIYFGYQFWSTKKVDKEILQFSKLSWFNMRQQLSCLQRLEITVCQPRVSPLWPRTFIRELRGQYIRLKALSLSFVDWSMFTDQDLNLLIQEIFSQFQNLGELHLHFRRCHSIPCQYLAFFEKGQEILKLSKLTLDFEGMRIGDRSLNVLAGQIYFMKMSLKELSLRFKNCQEITSLGLTFLSENCLQYLGDLDRLSLNFNDSGGITNEGLFALSKIGLVNLKNLKELNLCFENNNEIGDGGIRTLSVSLV